MTEIESKLIITSVSTMYRYNIHSDIHEGYDWDELFEMLSVAGPDDFVEININSGGGCVHVALAIAEAIRNCPAGVLCSVDGLAASAASLILMCGDAIQCGPHAEIMIHEGSVGFYGEPSKTAKEAAFYKKRLANIIKDYYSKYFTEEELASVLEGEDISILGSEMMERVANYNKGEDVGEE